MTIFVGNKKIVCRPGNMIDGELIPPNDLGHDEIWHMTAWTELAQKFLILRGSMLRETFPLFMELVEDGSQQIKTGNYAELGRLVFRRLLKLDFRAFGRGLTQLGQPRRDVLELKALNPNAWKLFDPVLTAPMAYALDTPAVFRRLDAMARLFHALLDGQFKPACVVVFAVPGGPRGVKFLVGCNNPPNHKNAPQLLAKAVFDTLWATTDVAPDVILALEMGIDLLNVLPQEDCEALRKRRVQRDHKKVLTWLTQDLEIKDAKTFAQCLEFVPVLVTGQPVHGDMAALIWLLTEEKSPLEPEHSLKPLLCSSSKLKENEDDQHPSWSILPKDHPFQGECYMGDSYLCCPYCAYVVTQYNIWARKGQNLLRIGARGYHTADQGGWRFVFKPKLLKALQGRRLDRLGSFIQFLAPLCEAMQMDRQEHIKRELLKEENKGETKEEKKQETKEEPKEETKEKTKTGKKGNKENKEIELQSDVLLRTLQESVESAFGAPPTIGFGGRFKQTISLRPSRSRSPSPRRDQGSDDSLKDL